MPRRCHRLRRLLVNSRLSASLLCGGQPICFPCPTALVAVDACVCARRSFPMPSITAAIGRTVRMIGVCSEHPCHCLVFHYDIPPFGMLSKPDWRSNRKKARWNETREAWGGHFGFRCSAIYSSQILSPILAPLCRALAPLG